MVSKSAEAPGEPLARFASSAQLDGPASRRKMGEAFGGTRTQVGLIQILEAAGTYGDT